jgi:hypothetical protein
MSQPDRPSPEVAASALREELRLLESEIGDLREELRGLVEDRSEDDSGLNTRMTEELVAQIALLELRREELRRRLGQPV